MLDSIHIADTFPERIETVDEAISSSDLSTIDIDYNLVDTKVDQDPLSYLNRLEEDFKQGKDILIVLNYVTATKLGFLLKIGEFQQKYNKSCRLIVLTCKSHNKLKKYVKAQEAQGNFIPKFRRVLYDTETEYAEANSVSRLLSTIRSRTINAVEQKRP